MANQAGSGQPRQHVGSYPGDDNDQPLTPQTFDIGTPPDLSGSLKSLGASSSDLPSSIQKSTVPTPMSDIVFGSDKPDLIEDYEGFNTGAKMPSNSMFGDVISASVSAPEPDSIDPRLLLLPTQMARPTGSAPTTPNITELNSDTLRYLVLWMLLNPGRLPSKTNLKSIENLSHAPGKSKAMMEWLENQVTVTSNPRLAKLLQRGDEAQQYRPKCVRRKGIQPTEPKVFACTNRCGQTFRRKGDWARHERTNFEEWACYICTEGLTRKEHLRAHLKDSHGMQDIDLENLEKYKQQLLAPISRPCGFCGRGFSSWWEWLAHVGAHFEGSIRGRTWKISEWKERKMTTPGSGRRNKRSNGHHNGGENDDDDEDDDDDDDDNGDAGGNNDDGTGANNGGGSALNGGFQASQNASGVGQGQLADHSFGSTYGNFNGFSSGAMSRTHGNVQRTPSLCSTYQIKAPIDHTQEIVHRMAALDVSAAEIGSASDAYAQASNYAPSPTNSKEHPRVKSHLTDVSTRTVTIPSHKEKRQVGKPHAKDSSTCGKEARSAAMLRWLHEQPRQEHWCALTRPGPNTESRHPNSKV
jgi:hypothetical protein